MKIEKNPNSKNNGNDNSNHIIRTGTKKKNLPVCCCWKTLIHTHTTVGWSVRKMAVYGWSALTVDWNTTELWILVCLCLTTKWKWNPYDDRDSIPYIWLIFFLYFASAVLRAQLIYALNHWPWWIRSNKKKTKPRTHRNKQIRIPEFVFISFWCVVDVYINETNDEIPNQNV